MARIALISIILLSCFTAAFPQDTADDPPWDVAPWPLENHRPQPQYPDVMSRAGVPRGRIDVCVSIDNMGNVTNVEITFEKPRHFMKEAVSLALWEWKFAPAQMKDEPVASEVSMTFHFQFVRPCILPEIAIDSSAVWMVRGLSARGIVESDSTIRHRNGRNGALVTYQPPSIFFFQPDVRLERIP